MTARVALVIALFAAPAFAQQPAPKIDADLNALGIGPVVRASPIEADGRPGSEWLIKREVFSAKWYILFPASPLGVCVSQSFDLPLGTEIADADGDGRADLVLFDVERQRVSVRALPAGRCVEN